MSHPSRRGGRWILWAVPAGLLIAAAATGFPPPGARSASPRPACPLGMGPVAVDAVAWGRCASPAVHLGLRLAQRHCSWTCVVRTLRVAAVTGEIEQFTRTVSAMLAGGLGTCRTGRGEEP